ncbi:MAG: hypothetical protein ACD_11C00145G0023 [uncultured bacterium]|nr:MAG: hypothetical protein ACD_11C00145G0023 [uncultured bacterium]HBR71886.1 hypothetical protein [Candidatus Moranbacteria bacterium]
MNKKIFLIIILVILATGLVVWFLFFAEKNGKISISQEDQKQIDQAPIVVESANENVVDSQQPAEKSPEEIVGAYEEEQKKPTETVYDAKEIVPQKEDVEKNEEIKIINKLVSWGYQKYSGERKIDTIIIHSTYNSLGGDEYSVDKIVNIYKSYEVAAHYLIARDGSVYKLVDENNIAYHAGVSKTPDGRNDVNKFSIGIEMIGNKTDGYTDSQYDAVSDLVKKIKKSHSIKYVLGHKDIAPERKTDPWKFDWDKI